MDMATQQMPYHFSDTICFQFILFSINCIYRASRDIEGGAENLNF